MWNHRHSPKENLLESLKQQWYLPGHGKTLGDYDERATDIFFEHFYIISKIGLTKQTVLSVTSETRKPLLRGLNKLEKICKDQISCIKRSHVSE